MCWRCCGFVRKIKWGQIKWGYLRIVPWSYGAAGIIMVVNAAFNGLGSPLPAVIISVTRTLILYVPLAYTASRLIGIPGIFAAACFSDLLSGIIAYACFRRRCRAHATMPGRGRNS